MPTLAKRVATGIKIVIIHNCRRIVRNSRDKQNYRQVLDLPFVNNCHLHISACNCYGQGVPVGEEVYLCDQPGCINKPFHRVQAFPPIPFLPFNVCEFINNGRPSGLSLSFTGSFLSWLHVIHTVKKKQDPRPSSTPRSQRLPADR